MKYIKEYANFGFGMPETNVKKLDDTSEDPLHPLNVEYIIKSLQNKAFGVKHAKSNDFFGKLEWGNDNGALQLQFSPLGGIRAVVRKLTTDLQGNPTWICKRVIEVKNFFDKYPDSLSFLLEEVLKETDNGGIEAALNNYDGLHRLTIDLASTLRRKTTQVIFMYEGIRMLKFNEKYIIHFGCTGYGRQKNQQRLDQFDIFTEYNPKTGMIRMAGEELGDSVAQYRWIYSPSTFLEYFSPAQPNEEIINAMLVHFNSY